MLLQFPIFCDVAVVTSSERKYGQQVRLIVKVPSQPRPGSKISGRKLRKWSGQELRVLSEKGRNFHSVYITDRTQAPSPGTTVAVGRQQVPPQFHLLLKRWRAGLQEDVPSDECRRAIERPCVFVGMSLVT